FAFVEDRLVSSGPQRAVWLKRFVDGEIAGNSWTEVGTVKIGDVITKVSPQADGTFRINGTKYYSTGSIFADWIDTFAQRTDDGTKVIAVVNAHQSGVAHRDDWDGFGQQTTGSGTSTFTDAVVEAENVIDFSTRFKYQTAFYQCVLLAVLAGSTRAAGREIAGEVSRRTRIFSHGNADSFAADPQILQVVGEVASRAYAAEAIPERAAGALQHAYEGAFLGDLEEEERRNDAAELESAQAQVVLTELATRATSDIFDALGASGTSTARNLDRHWRNARTAASHNPWVFKARIVGDHAVNGTVPPRVWAIGAGPDRQGTGAPKA
ncbi:monooxygenase, partial [Arthrobacter deserti]|nr:monooxygenase [Arthrobacter deserti]